MATTWIAMGLALVQSGPSRNEMASFLRTAAVADARLEGKGSTETWRVELEGLGIAHRASFQSIDVRQAVKNVGGGEREIDFVDSYRYNIAAYELSELIGLAHMVPVSVERSFKGRRGAMTWWVDDVLTDEAGMNERGLEAPDSKSWAEQIYRVRLFSELVHDTDRNQGNLLITRDWRIWMIDFSRAFRRWPKLRRPEALHRCDRGLFLALRELRREDLEAALGDILLESEIEGVWARRALLIEHFDGLVSARGEDHVLY